MVGNYANLSKHVTAHLNHSDDFLHIWYRCIFNPDQSSWSNGLQSAVSP
jgi:hypothetical protein